MEYATVLIVEENDDFEKLAHKGKMVEYVLIPAARKEEFLNSGGHKCLFPIAHKNGYLYYHV